MSIVQEKFSYMFDKELLEEIDKNKVIKKYKEESIIIEPGQEVTFIPFILEGAVKVLREDENGEELLLYYLESGDTCSMTLTCCYGRKKSKIKAIADIESEILFVPSSFFAVWMEKYESWRNFILTNYENKLNELLEAIDSLAFYNMEERIIKYLSDKVKIIGSLELDLTHQKIAEDLHSSRVVVSRILKKLEKSGKLVIHRNRLILKEF
ncbi:MAG: Crp/Fnr family transcriptional regulator [Flavobacteriia bacterium]|nr:Crp/Fnr family transcriptional regulator [Flavobacteriia bacterium]